MRVVSQSVEETKKVAEAVLAKLAEPETGATVIGLEGDLGAGKTTFVQQMANLLGIKGAVTSPTFTLIHVYKLPQSFKGRTHLIHIDCYRFEKGQELVDLGWAEMANDTKNLIFIEWPERVKEILPPDMELIKFKFIDEQTREIKIED